MYSGIKLLTVCSALVMIVLAGCQGQSQTTEVDPEHSDTMKEYKYYADWSVNTEYVLQGCSGGYDCIRSIDHPKFTSVQETSGLLDDDLVVGMRIGNEIKCYPHRILDWHEMVNDKMADKKYTINYCPLTGSAMAWNRVINGKETTFGVSGLLYNSNVIPYDRESGSHWSQMKQQCVNGEFYKQKIDYFPICETSWKTWKLLYPESEVLSFDTGYQRDYGEYPYADYRENEDVFFDTEYDNDTLFQKERLYGIIQKDEAKCYRMQNFRNGIRIVNDSVFGKNVVLIGSEQDNFIVAFENDLNGKKLSLKPLTGKAPSIAIDTEGNTFDIFGKCTEGPLKGQQLNSVDGFIAYWFAWAAFYPEVNLYN